MRLDRAGEKPVPKAGPAFTDTPTLAELGVDKKHAARARLIATIPPKKLEMIAADLRRQGRDAVRRSFRNSERDQARQDPRGTISEPRGNAPK